MIIAYILIAFIVYLTWYTAVQEPAQRRRRNNAADARAAANKLKTELVLDYANAHAPMWQELPADVQERLFTRAHAMSNDQLRKATKVLRSINV